MNVYEHLKVSLSLRIEAEGNLEGLDVPWASPFEQLSINLLVVGDVQPNISRYSLIFCSQNSIPSHVSGNISL